MDAHAGRTVTSQVSTDRFGRASGRIGVFGVVAQCRKGGTEVLEVGDLSVDVSQARAKQLAHMVAGRVAGVADVDHLADLAQGQAGGTASVDEVEPGHGVRPVVSVPVGGAFGRR